MGDFIYYRHDGAYFRRPANAPGIGVREVLHGDKWVTYQGDDLIEPVYYGSVVTDPLEVDELQGGPSRVPGDA